MYEHDIRHIVHKGTPEQRDRRLSAFRGGWTDALKGQKYQTLNKVKWRNLGWRFGHSLGHISPEKQERIFEILADLQMAERIDRDADDDE